MSNICLASMVFFIPERSYLIDLNGLLEFLIKMIVIDHNCLCCNFHGSGLESIRAHMASKRHCRLPYETKEERQLFAPFYDFTYDDHSISKIFRMTEQLLPSFHLSMGPKMMKKMGR